MPRFFVAYRRFIALTMLAAAGATAAVTPGTAREAAARARAIW